MLRRCASRSVLPIVAAMIMLGSLHGCRELRSLGRDTPVTGKAPSEAQLRAAGLEANLHDFADLFAAHVSAAADDIASRSPDRLVRELTLRWKLRMIPAIQDASRFDDPREGLLEMWMLCARQRMHVGSEELASILGANQALAIKTADTLEQEIVIIARRFLTDPRQLAEAQREVEDFAAGHPIKGRFAADLIRASDKEAALQGSGLSAIFSIPIGGVSETANAIDRAARVVAVAAEILEDLPERTRWQTELMMLEAERLPTVVDAREDFNRLTASIESISETMETLPAELQTVLGSADESQAAFQATIREARSTVEQSQAALKDLDETIGQARDLTSGVNEVTTGATDAAVAWEATAKSVEEVVTAIDKLSGSDDDAAVAPPDPDAKPFDPDDYTAAAAAIGSGAAEVRALLGDLESEKLAMVFDEADRASRKTIDHATAQVDALINKLTVRAILVVVVLLVGLTLYRVVTSRLAPR